MLVAHWWNPADIIPLVEIVTAESTDPYAVEIVTQLLRSTGKEPVHLSADVPGFVGNRLQFALWREAIALVDRGVCSAEDIDRIVRASFGRRLPFIGPMENADLIGLDLVRAITDTIWPDLSDSTSLPHSVLKHIDAGHLGAKSGSGYSSWDSDEAAAVDERLRAGLLALEGVPQAVDYRTRHHGRD